MGVVGMAQVSRSRDSLGKRVRHGARALARRAGLSPAAKAVAAGIVLVTVLVVLACAFLLPGHPGGSFVIERGDGPAAGRTQAETTPNDEADDASEHEDAETPPSMVVHVDGMVASPGVYRLQGDSLRVHDAVEAAGGLAEGADTSHMNLAEPLADGEKVHVPAMGEQDADDQAQESGATGAGGSVSPSSGGIVNINTATVAELTALPGVGEATAAEIIRDREANGAFRSVEDLMRVSGIGEKKFAKLKDRIRV